MADVGSDDPGDELAALRDSERRFRFLVEAAPDGVVILKAGRIVYMNPKAATLLGIDRLTDALGRSIGSFLPPDDARNTAERIATMFRTGQEMPPNEYGVLHDPSRVVEIKSIRCDWEGGPAVLAFARDVSERKAMQQRLVQADRLAALGTLAAGVAHEINNPLTYAQLSLQRIERALTGAALPGATEATLREALTDVHHGIQRIAAITTSLRTFARVDDSPPGAVDVIAVLDRALRMVDNDLRHRARLTRRFTDAPTVTGNASRLEQVFVNLLLNALQALRTADPAREEIEVTVEPRGARVAVAIRDTGRGMPASALDRVFDPFFTTKPIGEGMGLGLSVCKSIVEGIGGQLALESAENVGTTVTVLIPTRAPAPARSVPAPAHAPTTESQRVLVIDDDALVRSSLHTLLSKHHEVTTVASGEAALAAVRDATFDAIQCDMMMPGLDGRGVHRALAASHPGLERRIVFITGGTFAPELDEFLASCGNHCLHKPFRIEHVLATIATVASSVA